jgi:hypothetical protein
MSQMPITASNALNVRRVSSDFFLALSITRACFSTGTAHLPRQPVQPEFHDRLCTGLTRELLQYEVEIYYFLVQNLKALFLSPGNPFHLAKPGEFGPVIVQLLLSSPIPAELRTYTSIEQRAPIPFLCLTSHLL